MGEGFVRDSATEAAIAVFEGVDAFEVKVGDSGTDRGVAKRGGAVVAGGVEPFKEALHFGRQLLGCWGFKVDGGAIDAAGDDLHRFFAFAPRAGADPVGSLHDEGMPVEEGGLGEGGVEVAAEVGHEFPDASGAEVFHFLGGGVEAEVVFDGGHDVLSGEELALDGGGADGFLDHEIEEGFLVESFGKTAEEAVDSSGLLGKGKQTGLQFREFKAELGPVILLPVVEHEPILRLIGSF